MEGYALASRLMASSALAGLGTRARQPVSPVTASGYRARLAVAALKPLGDQPSGLACDGLNVAPQLFAGLGQAFK